MAIEAGRPDSKTGINLSEFRGPEPGKIDDEAAPSPPVADDDHSVGPAVDDVAPAPVAPKKEEPPARTGPKPSPFDEKRNRIAARFSERRRGDFVDSDGDFSKPENVYGKLAGQGDDAAPPVEGADTSTEAAAERSRALAAEIEANKPEPMTLAVNGKTVAKSLAEVAALADMTEDEVKADPARAKKYAQRELATSENLAISKSVRRETPSHQDDAGARPASHARNQGNDQTGDDDRGQPPASRDTSVEDMAKLVEDIQIGDPKEVAPKLAEFLAREAASAARGAVSASENGKARETEINAGVLAFKGLLDEHPEIADKPVVAAALARQLDEEYRTDLRKALIAEGDTPEDVDAILAKANQGDIRNAHMARRMNRDPNVRRIDKDMADHVYTKVLSDFGVTAAAPKPQALSREQRKQNLPHQPQRASVPHAAPTAPAPSGPISRRSVVAEMASRTGKRRPTLPR